MIAGLGTAAELVADHVTRYGDHMRRVRDYLEGQLEVRHCFAGALSVSLSVDQ